MGKSEPIGIGIVGIGRAGWGMHCKELQGREDKFRIVAACDPEKARRDQMAGRYGCAVYKDFDKLVADPNVELVDIASRSPFHVAQTLAALKAGKDVFVEKPMALTWAGAKKMATAAAKSRGRLYVRHNRRFEPGFQHIREIIASGILGDVYEIKLRRVSYSRRDDWQTLIACGGGQLLNWGPHIIDHGLQFLESPLAGLWSDLKKVAAVGDAEDHLKIVMTGENGRVVDLEISGGAALGEPEYLVQGSKGALRSSGNKITLRYLDPKAKPPRRRPKSGNPPNAGGFGSPDSLKWIEETIDVAPKAACSMDGIWDHLYAAIREGVEFPVKLAEAVEVMRVVSMTKKGTPFEPKVKE
jgi:scyllo-inositol 2-dehydrogenase (NADP+)